LGLGFTVTDDHGNQASVGIPNVRIIPINHPPVAVVQILPSDTVNPGTTVTLNASKSSDPDPEDHIKSFFWEQTAGPAVTLNSTSGRIVHFVAPSDVVQATTLQFNLTLIDSNPAPSFSITPVAVKVEPPNLCASDLTRLNTNERFSESASTNSNIRTQQQPVQFCKLIIDNLSPIRPEIGKTTIGSGNNPIVQPHGVAIPTTHIVPHVPGGSAQITVRTDPPTPNLHINLRFEPQLHTGGHDHLNQVTNQIRKAFGGFVKNNALQTQTDGVTNAAGIFTATFRAENGISQYSSPSGTVSLYHLT